uniref:Uncharacterized protein n=1 Tax=Tetranychus urticae TaxID=32264 RepID=T1JQ34_TETUR
MLIDLALDMVKSLSVGDLILWTFRMPPSMDIDEIEDFEPFR